MTAIKICGLQHRQEIVWANQLKLEYIGLVFASSSRQITPKQAKEITKPLSTDIKKVGVFVNCPLTQLKEIINYCALDIVQLHGEETPDYCQSIAIPIWKAIRIKDKNSLLLMNNYQVEGFLLDTYHSKQHGGLGISFDWSLLENTLTKKYNTILAGGLNIMNIIPALKIVAPCAIDISSGVELNGRKNRLKMLEIVKKVRSYDATVQ